jgi:hypothetical protein
MAINFPLNPTTGQTYTSSGKTWAWNGAQWEGVPVDLTKNNFNLDVGTSGNNIYVLSGVKSAGIYSITSQLSDTLFDVYAITSTGQLAGYTKTKSLTATLDFDKIVLYGATTNDLLTFENKTTSLPTQFGTLNSGAGPGINSISPTAAPSLNDTITVYGENFASGVQVQFIGTNLIPLLAKSITRVSSTQLSVTRPDGITIDNSPYTLVASNPGIPNPTATNEHILSNCLTVGTYPAWQSPATIPLPFSQSIAYTYTLVAADTENSQITYQVTTGSLPAGLSMSSSGVISGTPTASLADGTTTVFTVRATDAGNHYVDRQFTMIANAAPLWNTASGALTEGSNVAAYSYQLSATGNSYGTNLTYSIVSGALPTGLSLSSSGLISGTASAGGTSSFTARVTDEYGKYTDRAFSLKINGVATYTSSGSFTVPAGVTSLSVLLVAGGGGGQNGTSSAGGGGGGAGGVLYTPTYAVTPGAVISVGIAGASGVASTGGNSTFGTLTANGGGNGASYGANGGNGGSGGGGVRNGSNYGTGIAGQGNRGGYSTQSFNSGCGGGGKSAAGGDLISTYQDAAGGAGIYLNTINSFLPNTAVGGGGGGGNWSNGGAITTRAAGGVGGGGAGGQATDATANNGATAGTANTGGGGGGGGGKDTGYSGAGAGGGSGICYVLY